MAAPFETHGKGWDKLTETKEGQDILNEWGEVSTCYMKMNSAYFNYANEEELNVGDSVDMLNGIGAVFVKEKAQMI